jgi:hypothetical protein
MFVLEDGGRGCSVTATHGDFTAELAFTFTSEYPSHAAIGVNVRSTAGCPPLLEVQLKAIAAAAATSNKGDPAVFTIVNEVQEFLSDPAAVAAAEP